MSVLRRLLSLRPSLDDEPLKDDHDYEPHSLDHVDPDLYDPADDVGETEK